MPKTNVKVKLTGVDSNTMVLLGTVTKALRKANHRELIDELVKKVMNSQSQDQAIQHMMEYVEVS